jgi:hypothetical protein
VALTVLFRNIESILLNEDHRDFSGIISYEEKVPVHLRNGATGDRSSRHDLAFIQIVSNNLGLI